MFSRTLLFRQILSGLKRFQMDKLCKIPHLSGLKRFLADNLFNLSHLSVKYALFTDKFGLGTACTTYFLPQSRISERI